MKTVQYIVLITDYVTFFKISFYRKPRKIF